jgi:hypothetical protein
MALRTVATDVTGMPDATAMARMRKSLVPWKEPVFSSAGHSLGNRGTNSVNHLWRAENYRIGRREGRLPKRGLVLVLRRLRDPSASRSDCPLPPHASPSHSFAILFLSLSLSLVFTSPPRSVSDDTRRRRFKNYFMDSTSVSSTTDFCAQQQCDRVNSTILMDEGPKGSPPFF